MNKNQPFRHRLGYALAGLHAAWRHERSFRTQSVFAVGAFVFLLVLRPAPIWWALIGVMVALVLAAELINTALEHLADHLHPDHHPRIGLAKDGASGAVLILSVAAVWVALLALWSEWG